MNAGPPGGAPEPMVPRPGVFRGMLIGFVCWLAALWAMWLLGR